MVMAQKGYGLAILNKFAEKLKPTPSSKEIRSSGLYCLGDLVEAEEAESK